VSERRGDEVGVLVKALDILNCLAVDAPCSAAHLSERTGVTKPAAYRILKTLDAGGYVTRDEERREYLLGPALYGLSRAARAASGLVRVARPAMEALHAELGETVNLGVLSHGQVVYLDTIESTQRLRSTVQIALRDRIHCTALGKAVLAVMSPASATAVLGETELVAVTPNTVVDIPALLRELATIRTRGYAVDDEENEVGSRCVAAAIVDAAGRPVAALSISAPTARMQPKTLDRTGRQVAQAAEQLGSQLA
jgi:IclR family transcriptional regulator, acetate operon repressor